MVLAHHLAPGYTLAQFQVETARAQGSRQHGESHDWLIGLL